MIKVLAHVPIFNRSVFFVGDCSQEEGSGAVYRLKGRKTVVAFPYDSIGAVVRAGGDVFVWVEDLEIASVVAHELVHAAVSIMEICNIPLCRDTEELMCFLVGWLKINVQDKVYAKRIKRNKKVEL